jgi:hypothetical protein|tara:strand:+ start:193 stop:498 length:306 start_codon:yes stop_codon:yes gene_type:complete
MDEGLLDQKRRLIEAGKAAVNELIKVAESIVIRDSDSNSEVEYTELAADKMKNAAASKKLAIFDAFEILKKMEEEEQYIEEALTNTGGDHDEGGFAERHAN